MIKYVLCVHRSVRNIFPVFGKDFYVIRYNMLFSRVIIVNLAFNRQSKFMCTYMYYIYIIYTRPIKVRDGFVGHRLLLRNT